MVCKQIRHQAQESGFQPIALGQSPSLQLLLDQRAGLLLGQGLSAQHLQLYALRLEGVRRANLVCPLIQCTYMKLANFEHSDSNTYDDQYR